MTSEDDAHLSVTGTAHLHSSDEPTGGVDWSTVALAAATATLVALTTLAAVRSGYGTLGLGLLTASVLTVGSAGALELFGGSA